MLHVALFLHDIGKGDPRDHSELGAELAARLCPRFGLGEAETEMVVWLIRHHLLMSDVAQKRDIYDPRTIAEFAREVRSPQRLRLLLVLTVCDIQAVGPGVWNDWKAQLLRDLYHATRDLLTGGGASRASQVAAAQHALREALIDWEPARLEAELARHHSHYWLGLDTPTHLLFANLAQEISPDRPGRPDWIAMRFLQDPRRDTTMVCIQMDDHPGLFARMAGALAYAGADVVDARSYTTIDAVATAVFWIQDHDARPFTAERLPRLQRSTERALRGEVSATRSLIERDHPPRREQSFRVPTRILFDNEASELHTLIEVSARDRPGLLHDLARTLAALHINIVTAIIATYGAHAVDVFYVKDRFGLKIRSQSKFDQIRQQLTEAVNEAGSDRLAAAPNPPVRVTHDRDREEGRQAPPGSDGSGTGGQHLG